MKINRQPRRRGAAAGFTLIELTIVGVILGSVMTTVGGIYGHARAEQSMTSAYATDLEDLRRALAMVEADLRLGSRCEARDRALAIHTGSDRAVVYRWGENTTLIRRDSNGREQAVARCIADVEVDVEGRLAIVGLRMRARGHSQPATVWTCVAMRNGGRP